MTTILVVDDSPVDRKLVGTLLERRWSWKIEHAATGTEALAKMKLVLPDLVVTDLTMPEMDGLELVRAVRQHYPDVPVILMTAYGTDTLALEALELGAASYVPKSQLAARLPETADSILRIAEQNQERERLLQRLERIEFDFMLENEPELIQPLVSLVQQTLAGMQFTDFAGRLQMGVALKEAVLNALFHGNLQITRDEIAAVSDRLLGDDEVSLVDQRRAQPEFRDRKIHVHVQIDRRQATFVVRDDGPGFDVAKYSATAGAAPELEEHRGFSLMRTFMDEVHFNAKGNEVTLIKRREKEEAAKTA
ncbi:MAG: response regulator [Thermogutta sp.]